MTYERRKDVWKSLKIFWIKMINYDIFLNDYDMCIEKEIIDGKILDTNYKIKIFFEIEMHKNMKCTKIRCRKK